MYTFAAFVEAKPRPPTEQIFDKVKSRLVYLQSIIKSNILDFFLSRELIKI